MPRRRRAKTWRRSSLGRFAHWLSYCSTSPPASQAPGTDKVAVHPQPQRLRLRCWLAMALTSRGAVARRWWSLREGRCGCAIPTPRPGCSASASAARRSQPRRCAPGRYGLCVTPRRRAASASVKPAFFAKGFRSCGNCSVVRTVKVSSHGHRFALGKKHALDCIFKIPNYSAFLGYPKNKSKDVFQKYKPKAVASVSATAPEQGGAIKIAERSSP